MVATTTIRYLQHMRSGVVRVGTPVAGTYVHFSGGSFYGTPRLYATALGTYNVGVKTTRKGSFSITGAHTGSANWLAVKLD